MLQQTWISTVQLAELAGISRQASHKIALRALSGAKWRGQAVEARARKGSGGASGTIYEVALSSLPEALQRAFSGVSEGEWVPDAPPLIVRPIPAPNQTARVRRLYELVAQAISHPPRSTARAEALRRSAERYNVPLRTLQRHVAKLEAAGGDLNALARKRPIDAGERRAHVSRKFDQVFIAAGYPADWLEHWGQRLDQLCKAAWASKCQREGWRRVRLEVATSLKIELREAGFSPYATSHALARQISRRRVESHSSYRIVDIRENDRKRYDDMKPRIRRDHSRLRPLEMVVMDVKWLDNVTFRPDGTDTTPKLIGFYDMGTGRLFSEIVQTPKGEGIRQEHVIRAFAKMVADPEWGFPETLYRDNGVEFYMFDKLRELLALLNEPGARTIINAKPYQGASKPIESVFSMIQRSISSQMAGYIGGDRQNQKKQTLGRPATPYPSGFEQFIAEIHMRLRDWHGWTIQSGSLAGKSRLEHYADHVVAGWRPVRIHPAVLDATFAVRETRLVTGGVVRFGGYRWAHPELPRLNGETITIAIPYAKADTPLVLLPGELGWAHLTTDELWHPKDIDGARHASRRQRDANRAVTSMKRDAGFIDLEPNLHERVGELPALPAPGRVYGIDPGSELQSFADARRIADEARAIELSDGERRRKLRDRTTERLLRSQGRAA